MVAQDRSFLKPRRSGKSGTSHTVAFEHAKASAALAASFKSRLRSKPQLTGEQTAQTCANAVNVNRACRFLLP